MNNIEPSIRRNSFFISISIFVRLITNFILSVGIARLYGTEIFGKFTFVMTFANISLLLADFGFDILLTTEIARNKEKLSNIISKYFSIKIFLLGISAIVMVILPNILDFEHESKILIYLLILYVIFSSILNFIYSVFRGIEKFELETKISLPSNIFLLVFAISISFIKLDVTYVIITFIAARLIGVLLGIEKLSRGYNIKIFRIDFSEWKTGSKEVLIFGFNFLFGNLFINLDTILLNMWKGDEITGIYQAAFKILVMVLLFTEVIRKAIFPKLSRLFETNKKNWKQLNLLTLKILILISVVFTIGLFTFADSLVLLLYGEEYRATIPILKVFSLIVFVRFIAEIFNIMLTTSKRQYILTGVMFFSVVFVFLLNYYLIPSYGALGAAYSSLLVNILIALAVIWANKNYSLSWFSELKIPVSLIFSVFLFFIMWNFEISKFLAVFLIIIISVIFFLLLFNKEEKLVIYKNFHKN